MLRAAHWALGRRGVSGYTIVGRVHNSGKRLCSLLDRVMKYDVTIYRVYHCSLSTFHHGRSINLAAANPETVEIWGLPYTLSQRLPIFACCDSSSSPSSTDSHVLLDVLSLPLC